VRPGTITFKLHASVGRTRELSLQEKINMINFIFSDKQQKVVIASGAKQSPSNG
jgi:hypothetical protein